ncbi:MAG TPA: tripartite tricarboxylate transporter TctB family protein [Candidatus Udaeobacter sp.]|nr:tripartite tricarboxylate transporter TctB family protein [Candidatus Udaeobacter sp.]
MKIKPQAIFSLCALIFFIVFVYQAQEWRLQARLYPYAIGIPMVILAIAQVILDLRGFKAKQPSDGAPTPMDFQFTKGIDPLVARRRTVNIFSWILGFFIGVWLLGFSITIPLLVFSYLKIQSGEKWAISLFLTAVAWLVFYGLFVRLLTLPFPEGLIFTWIGV